MDIIQRKGQVVQVWEIEYQSEERFMYKLFVRGTEDEVRAYMESEMGYMGRYSACTDEEIRAIRKLRMKIYLAPQL